MKGLFKRVDGIALSLVFFYCLIVGFVGLCLDPNSTIVMTSNPIASLATALGFAEIESLGIPSGIMLAMILVYTFLFALAVIVEVRLAQNADEKPYSAKWLSIMAASLVVLYGLGIGIGSVSHLAFDDGANLIAQSLAYSGEAMLLGLVIAIVAYLAIFFLVLLVYCIVAKSKPIEDEVSPESEEAKKLEELEEKVNEARDAHNGEVSSSFAAHSSGEGVGSGSCPSNPDDFYAIDRTRVFPSI